MIELTIKEAIAILTKLSKIDGFLMNIEGSDEAREELDYPIDVLTEKLGEDDK